MKSHRATKKPTVVQMVRWYIPKDPRWSKWHLTQTGEHTWCGRRIRNGVFPKYDESQYKDWRGEKDVCGLCIRHYEAHGRKKP